MDAELDELLAALPAVALDGPKGVGKTATAEARSRTRYQLDRPTDRAIAEADPSALLDAPPPVLLDEWQHVPAVWDAVRRAVDADRTPNRFLLAGSAAPRTRPAHTGAGRIVSVRMRPLALAERGLAEPTVSLHALLNGTAATIGGHTQVDLAAYAAAIVESGFPGFRDLRGRALRSQLDGYLQRIVERDFPEQGLTTRSPAALRRWMTAYAAATATTTSYEKIRDAAAAGDGSTPAKASVAAYRGILDRLRITDPLPGWLPTRSALQRLTQAPKHHLADPALAARLLGVDADALLLAREPAAPAPKDGVLFGNLFESLVTQAVRVYAQAAEARTAHLRTQDGRQEIDLIVERADHRVLAIEVKLSSTVTDDDVVHLHWLKRKLGAELLDMVVIHTGAQAYRRADGVAVVPAVLLGP